MSHSSHGHTFSFEDGVAFRNALIGDDARRLDGSGSHVVGFSSDRQLSCAGDELSAIERNGVYRWTAASECERISLQLDVGVERVDIKVLRSGNCGTPVTSALATINPDAVVYVDIRCSHSASGAWTSAMVLNLAVQALMARHAATASVYGTARLPVIDADSPASSDFRASILSQFGLSCVSVRDDSFLKLSGTVGDLNAVTRGISDNRFPCFVPISEFLYCGSQPYLPKLFGTRQSLITALDMS